MGYSRYNSSKEFILSNPLYDEYLSDKRLNFIKGVDFLKFKYPSVQQIQQLSIHPHIWSSSDKFSKLAQKYYKDSKFWWIIPFYNMKYLESDFNLGDVVYIPLPLEKFINFVEL